MKEIKEGILIGRDRLGRGILLTPVGEYRHAFISGEAQPGDVVQYGTNLSFRTAMALSAALTGAACILISFAISLSATHPGKIAKVIYPNPPRSVIYATLYLKSKSGDPVALDLDRQGHVVMVRVLGVQLAQREILGRPVSDVLKNRVQLLAGVKIVPGEPLGLQVRKSDMGSEPATGDLEQLRSMEPGGNPVSTKSV
jgi:hypothetical protein